MKHAFCTSSRLLVALILLSSGVVADGHNPAHAQEVGAVLPSMNYPRVYSSPDGESHFQDVAVTLSPTVYVRGIPLVDVSPSYSVGALTFSHLAARYKSDWHHAPRWQFVVILSGAMEITASDGKVRDFRPGSVVLVEDTTGKGHRTRTLGTDECYFVTIALTPHN